MAKSKAYRVHIAFLMGLLSPLAAWGDWKAPRESLDNHRVQGEFRIFYTLDGTNAFPRDVPYSQRKGKVNDFLDQLILQVTQANQFYSNDIGLIPPLKNKRYLNVHAIDVQILNLGEKMGTTGDGIVTYHYLNFDSATPVITISLTNRWKPPNLTPAHELFHAFQYGYTFFKNPWFLEGLARSMENAFRDAQPKSDPLPKNKFELQKIMSRSYSAELFWNRLIKLCDPQCSSAIPAIFVQPRLCGGFFIRSLLEQYQTIDDSAALERGIDPLDWTEAEQLSEKNNPYLVLGLRRSIENQCPMDKLSEISQFDNLLKQVVIP